MAVRCGVSQGTRLLLWSPLGWLVLTWRGVRLVWATYRAACRVAVALGGAVPVLEERVHGGARSVVERVHDWAAGHVTLTAWFDDVFVLGNLYLLQRIATVRPLTAPTAQPARRYTHRHTHRHTRVYAVTHNGTRVCTLIHTRSHTYIHMYTHARALVLGDDGRACGERGPQASWSFWLRRAGLLVVVALAVHVVVLAAGYALVGLLAPRWPARARPPPALLRLVHVASVLVWWPVHKVAAAVGAVGRGVRQSAAAALGSAQCTTLMVIVGVAAIIAVGGGSLVYLAGQEAKTVAESAWGSLAAVNARLLEGASRHPLYTRHPWQCA
jgi:hypothetical protein